MSDTHTDHKAVYKKIIDENLLDKNRDNILVHTGDWSQLGNVTHSTDFCAWLKEVKSSFRYVVLVCGNHERTCGLTLQHKQLKQLFDDIPGVYYLTYDILTLEEFGNLTFLGISWWDPTDLGAPPFNGMKALPVVQTVNKNRVTSSTKCNHIDFLLSHHPPYGILDEWKHSLKGSHRIVSYLTFLDRLQLIPKFHIFGHVHKVGKQWDEIAQKSKLYPLLLHINVAQSVAYYDYYY